LPTLIIIGGIAFLLLLVWIAIDGDRRFADHG
jgi:hypothetical protein